MILYSQNPSLKKRITADGYYLYNPTQECAYELNYSAFQIWRLCDVPISKQHLTELILEKYPNNHNIELMVNDIEVSISQMVKIELLITAVTS